MFSHSSPPPFQSLRVTFSQSGRLFPIIPSLWDTCPHKAWLNKLEASTLRHTGQPDCDEQCGIKELLEKKFRAYGH